MSIPPPPPPPDPPPPPPPPSPPDTREDRFHWRNWWRNGAACRVTAAFALLAIFGLFQPWEGDMRGSGWSETHWEGNQQVRRSYSGHSFTGGGTAFDKGSSGWISLIALGAALWVCGRPRRLLGGVRWLPLWAGVIVMGCMYDDITAWDKAMQAWLAKFGSKPVVTPPSGMLDVLWLALGVAVAGGFFARKKPTPSA